MIVDYLCFARSHEDFDTWAPLSAGIDDFKQLVVCLSYYDYEDELHNGYAIMDSDNTANLAKQLGLEINELPEMIYEEYEDAFHWVPSDVDKTFQDVLEKFLDHGVKFHLKPME